MCKNRIISIKNVNQSQGDNAKQDNSIPMSRMSGPEADISPYSPLLVQTKPLHGSIVANLFIKQSHLIKILDTRYEIPDTLNKKNSIVLALGYSPEAGLGPSTIAANELNCCVRDGNRCAPVAASTKTMKSLYLAAGCQRLAAGKKSPAASCQQPTAFIIRRSYVQSIGIRRNVNLPVQTTLSRMAEALDYQYHSAEAISRLTPMAYQPPRLGGS